jgi:CRP/FNR family cyclic AMP-dependent transcriptional regulator
LTPEQAAELLGRSELFSGLDASRLRTVAAQVTTRRYRKGSLIFCQGDPGDSVYVLVEGSVKVFVSSEDGGQMVLATLGPHDALGEIALLDGGERSASVEVLEPVTALVLTRGTMLELLRVDPVACEALLLSACSLLRKVTGQAADLVFLDLEGRVAKLLVGLSERRGAPSEAGVVLDLGLTQSDLAGMVGGSRQSVNQILRGLEGRGFIELRGRTLLIARPDALRRRCGLR